MKISVDTINTRGLISAYEKHGIQLVTLRMARTGSDSLAKAQALLSALESVANYTTLLSEIFASRNFCEFFTFRGNLFSRISQIEIFRGNFSRIH